MSVNWHFSALSHFNQAVIRSNIVPKEEYTKHTMLRTEFKHYSDDISSIYYFNSVRVIICFIYSSLATMFDLMMVWLKWERAEKCQLTDILHNNNNNNNKQLLDLTYIISHFVTRVGTLIVATIYLQLIQNRYMFRSFTLLQCSHQHCVQPVASDVEVVGYL